MGIVILRNQPIDFNPVADDPDCGCEHKSFCQLIDPTDATQFQLGSTDTIINGHFELGDYGWLEQIPLQINIISLHNETSPGACDGSITVGAIHGSAPYRFSFNGGTFGSPGFNDGQAGLCAGCYFVTVKDSIGREASYEYCIDTDVVCGDYKTTDSLVTVRTSQIIDCLTSDFI